MILMSDQLTEAITYIEANHKAFENRYTPNKYNFLKDATNLWERGKRKWGIVEWYEIVYAASNIYDDYVKELYNNVPTTN